MSEAAFRTYLGKVEHDLRTGDAREHSYRPYFKALVEELRSEHFDRAGTIVRLVVALIALAPVAAAHALMRAALK